MSRRPQLGACGGCGALVPAGHRIRQIDRCIELHERLRSWLGDSNELRWPPVPLVLDLTPHVIAINRMASHIGRAFARLTPAFDALITTFAAIDLTGRHP